MAKTRPPGRSARRPPKRKEEIYKYPNKKGDPKKRVHPGRMTVSEMIRCMSILEVPEDAVIVCEVDHPDSVGWNEKRNTVIFS